MGLSWDSYCSTLGSPDFGMPWAFSLVSPPLPHGLALRFLVLLQA